LSDEIEERDDYADPANEIPNIAERFDNDPTPIYRSSFNLNGRRWSSVLTRQIVKTECY
jgi:hypothetical protein